jgi:hypothetical protein
LTYFSKVASFAPLFAKKNLGAKLLKMFVSSQLYLTSSEIEGGEIRSKQLYFRSCFALVLLCDSFYLLPFYLGCASILAQLSSYLAFYLLLCLFALLASSPSVTIFYLCAVACLP